MNEEMNVTIDLGQGQIDMGKDHILKSCRVHSLISVDISLDIKQTNKIASKKIKCLEIK